MTTPYPELTEPTAAELRHFDAEPVPYFDADNDDLIASFIGSIGSAKYDARGSFVLTLEIPFDVIGDPTDLMRSQGMMLVWQARKI